MPGKRVNAVLFDLGDTLLRFGRLNKLGVFIEGARSSYRYIRQLDQPTGSFWRYLVVSFVSLRVHCWCSNITGKDFDALGLLRRNGRKRGVNLSERQWEELAWRWYQPLTKVCKLESDLRSTLQRLKQMGLKLGIVSNTFVHSSSLERHLEEAGLLEFFDVKAYSYQFIRRKPAPEIFLAAAEMIGEEPADILFVGDRINKDIVPAMKAGMNGALISAYTNSRSAAPEGAFEIERIAELPHIVADMNTKYRVCVEGGN